MQNYAKRKFLFGFILDIIILKLGSFLNLIIAFRTGFSVFSKFPLGIIFEFRTVFAKSLLKVSGMS